MGSRSLTTIAETARPSRAAAANIRSCTVTIDTRRRTDGWNNAEVWSSMVRLSVRRRTLIATRSIPAGRTSTEGHDHFQNDLRSLTCSYLAKYRIHWCTMVNTPLVINKKGLFISIDDKEHWRVEHWTPVYPTPQLKDTSDADECLTEKRKGDERPAKVGKSAVSVDTAYLTNGWKVVETIAVW